MDLDRCETLPVAVILPAPSSSKGDASASLLVGLKAAMALFKPSGMNEDQRDARPLFRTVLNSDEAATSKKPTFSFSVSCGLDGAPSAANVKVPILDTCSCRRSCDDSCTCVENSKPKWEYSSNIWTARSLELAGPGHLKIERERRIRSRIRVLSDSRRSCTMLVLHRIGPSSVIRVCMSINL